MLVSAGLRVSRGDSRYTLVNEIAGLRLLLAQFPEVIEFPADRVLRHVKPGLYSKRKS